MIEVKEGIPVKNGKYVCWVNPEHNVDCADTIFLMWFNGRWFYPKSTQRYREHVYQFTGPIPVLNLED